MGVPQQYHKTPPGKEPASLANALIYLRDTNTEIRKHKHKQKYTNIQINQQYYKRTLRFRLMPLFTHQILHHPHITHRRHNNRNKKGFVFRFYREAGVELVMEVGVNKEVDKEADG